MSPSLFDEPVRDAPPAFREAEPAHAPRRGAIGRSRLAAVVVISSLLGGAGATGVLVAVGAVGTDAPSATTIVETAGRSTAQVAAGGSAPALDAAALYARNAAGVVDITASGASDASVQRSPFGDPTQPQRSTATGTGFVIDGAGHIATAAHVIDGASSISVTFQDGSRRTATLTSKDEATDVALLKVDPAGMSLHPLALGSSAALRAGDPLAAIGDPFGYERSISTGVVSGLDRTIQAPNGFTVAHAIQTDASLNPGNSGGPILDAAGHVVGIADQIATGGASASAGVGFLVPIDLVKSELPALKAGRTVRHAYLGVSTSSAPDQSGGAVVQQVTSGGPAADAGLRAGDTITAVDGSKVADSNGLISAIAAHAPGDHISVTVRRGSGDSKLDVTLGTQPASVQSR